MQEIGRFKDQYLRWLDTAPCLGERALFTLLWDNLLSQVDHRKILLCQSPDYAASLKLFLFRDPYDDRSHPDGFFLVDKPMADLHALIEGKQYMEFSIDTSGCIAGFDADHEHCDFFGYPHR
jgi:hypothetical protein